MIISFVNQKGGVGKTTTAINLAIGLKKKNYNLVFIDADPQGSAVQWHAIEGNKSFEILHHPSPIHATDIRQLSMNYDYVIIDAPPAIGDISKAILAVTDLAIIPLSPSALDVWSCWGTLKMVDEIRPLNSDIEVKLLINRKIPGTKIGRDSREAMKQFQMDVFNTELCQRVAFIDAMTSGVSVMQYAPHSKAAREIERLCEEIIPQVSMEAFQPQVNNQYLDYSKEKIEYFG
ncbi:MAG: AAA family ATPase [Deltaproteobacteria bacterium]|jgi:chromosome partitioning protein|nr:AAA family ATPase [Deltaproteobacteria bacterium]